MTHSRDIELGDECPTPLSRLSELAKEDPARRFYSIAHFLTPRALYEAVKGLRKDASAGMDGTTFQEYQKELGPNLQDLWERVKSGQYRAVPLRRVYISKEDGKSLRGLSIPALEDKIVQAAAVRLLNSIYEVDFLDCSYGSRPGRDAHQALDEINRALYRESITHVLELDIKTYFDSIVRKQLMEMIERRVSDGSILQLIGKWLNVGFIENGRLFETKDGVGQGQVASPFLANVYLHHVLDKWFEDEVKPRLKGKAFLVRYVDDAVICFQNAQDAQKVLMVLDKRFSKYGLTLHPEKTRLVEFGRSALRKAERMGTAPPVFDFLGFTHITERSRRGFYRPGVRTMKKRLKRGLKKVGQWCKQHRHDPIKQQQETLNAKLRGHYQYYGRSSNFHGLWRYYRVLRKTWFTWLRRRSRGTPMSWETYAKLLKRYPLLKPSITHPWAISRSPA